MKKIPKTVWVLGLVLVALLGIKQCMAGDVLRYKVTVTVTTPEGEKTGYAVREAGRETEMRILPQQGGVFYNVVKGEAVVVDLGKRGVLFFLIGGQREAEYVFKAFPSKENKDRVAIPLEQFRFYYPQFVHFKSLSDPGTVEKAVIIKIEGGQSYGPFITGGHVVSINLDENIFGKGVDLKDVIFERSGEPVTAGIEKYLPWVPRVKMSYIDGGHSSASAPLGLGGNDFQIGEK